MSGKCVPEKQSELAVCSLGRDCTGSGSCAEPYGFCPLGWKVRSPGLELFLKHFLRSPRLAWREYRERSICSVLICICTLSCIHYLTSLGLGRGSRAECGSSMRFPAPCGELSRTVNETVARAGQVPAGGLVEPGRLQGPSCARVTWPSAGASWPGRSVRDDPHWSCRGHTRPRGSHTGPFLGFVSHAL